MRGARVANLTPPEPGAASSIARRDWVSCGGQRDTVVADRLDRVARDCERVLRRQRRYARVVGCCSPASYGRVFSERWARLDARRYRLQGLDPGARRIVQHLRARGLEGRTVLEIGGGIGALGIELLQGGAERVVNVELSTGYESTARRLLEERGLLGRVERLLGDLVAQPELTPPADVVVLHRVVCCYPDAEALVGAAAEHARGEIVLSFPRDVWWNRVGFRTLDLALTLASRGFRTFVRPADAVLRAARTRGFRPALDEQGLVWRVASLERAVGPPPAV